MSNIAKTGGKKAFHFIDKAVIYTV